MSYQAFLVVMSQLAGNQKARAVIDGNVVFFESSFQKKNRMKIYTKVFDGDGYLPKSVRSCLSSSGTLRWHHGGACLKLDPKAHCVWLIEEFEMTEGKYIPFRNALGDFSLAVEEWKQTLQEIAAKDHSFIH